MIQIVTKPWFEYFPGKKSPFETNDAERQVFKKYPGGHK